MPEHRCPQTIFELFNNASNERDLSDARILAIEWMKKQELSVGDKVIMPDPATGEEITFVKSENVA